MSRVMDARQCRVALLAGGKSGEREVSLASGKGACDALEEAGFNVTILDPAEKSDLKRLVDGPFDVAFICLHGRFGEDGTVQGFLETVGLPYIGSGIWSSALAIDKVKSKLYFEKEGLLTPPSVSLQRGGGYDASAIVEKLGEECVVKPGKEGSTLGVYIVKGPDAVEGAIARAFELDDEVLVEKYIQGKELTVAVVGNNEVKALPIIEIIAKSGFYDYAAKYTPGGSQHICPAPLSKEITKKVQDMAERAHRALSCSGVSRSDLILDDDNKCWIIETNTIPGMTGTSLLPDAARAAGITFAQLCTQLIELALDKQELTKGS